MIKIISFVILFLAGAGSIYFFYEQNKYNEDFFEATRNGDEKKVKSLIAKGASLDARDGVGQTPLHSAVYNGHYKIVKILLQKGADPNAKDNRGGTALHWASTSNVPVNISLLLKNGAKVNIVDKFDMTPLNWAVSEEKIDAVRILLENGANPKRKNSRKKTAIDDARIRGNQKILKLLKKAN